MQVLSDLAAERAVLGGIYRYGADTFYDVVDIINEATFVDKSNALIFKCFKHILQNEQKIDIPSVYSAAKELDIEYVLSKTEEVEHLNAITLTPVIQENVRKFAAKIRKLQIARLLKEQLEFASDKITEVDGSESINSIIGIAENTIIDFSSLINDVDDNPKLIGENLTDYVKHLAENPVDQVGLSTGYTRYDTAIGGGLRGGTVNVIGARIKTGKSVLAANIGLHVAKNVGIPVLMLDTEMTIKDQRDRMLAMSTEVAINDIETGQFAKHGKYHNLFDAANQFKNYPIYFKSIAGLPFEDQIAIARRWLLKVVGLNPDGTAKPCMITYDYIKLMDGKGLTNIAEFQALGFVMTGLHNFAVRYNLPIMAFAQLNRDGIDKETTDVAAGSDRILWLCSNFAIYKIKSDLEIADDGAENGNRKLVVAATRHGAGLADKEYINMYMRGKYASIKEGRTNLELRKEKNIQQPSSDTFETTHTDDNTDFGAA
jgi:replicative DNA helicase